MESSSIQQFSRKRTVHQILGGGFIADVILWRQPSVTVGIFFTTLGAWLVFEKSGQTLLSLASNVLLLLVVVLFLWAKAAEILNRPPPPLPTLQLSEEAVIKVATYACTKANMLILISRDVSLGKDPKLFLKVAVCLLVISVIGGLADFPTLCYASIFIILLVPALYERHENFVHKYGMVAFMELRKLYKILDEKCIRRIRKWILQTRKLS